MRRASQFLTNSGSAGPAPRRRSRHVTGLGRFGSAGALLTVVLSFTTVFGAFATNAGAATTTGAPAVTHVLAHDGGGGNNGNGNDGNAGHSGGGSPSGNNGNDKCVGNAPNAPGGPTPSARSPHGDSQDGPGWDNDGDDNCASYTVTFVANGGNGAMQPETANTPTPLTLNAFTWSGHTFTGWNTDANGSGTPYADGSTYSFTASTTLYAQWTQNPIVCTTQTDHLRTAHDDQGDGGNSAGDNDNDGDDSGNCPPRSATFSVAKSAVVSGSDINYTITATNSGSASGTVSLTDAIPTGTTYVSASVACASATCSESGGTVTWTATVAAPGSATLTFSVNVDPTTTSVSNTAYWSGPGCATNTCSTNTVTTPTTDTVTLQGNGGTFAGGATSTTTSCPIGGVITLANLTQPTRSGYTFAGWSMTSGGSVIGTATINCSTTTLYAQWTVVPNNAASFSVAKSAVVSGSDINYTITATNSGSASGSVSLSDAIPAGTTYVNGSVACASATCGESNNTVTWSATVAAPGSATLTFSVSVDPTTTSVVNTAYWSGPGCASSNCPTNTVTTPTTDTVTLEGNGGTFTGGAMSTTTSCPIGGVITLANLTAPTRAGYTLAGWSTTSTGSVIATATIGCSTTTLYAQWTANNSGPVTDTVTFNSEGGSAVSPVSGADGTYVSLPGAPVLAGYSFDGWFYEPSGGSPVTSPYKLVGTLTLYAQWTANGGGGGGGGSVINTATISITNMPAAPEKGSSFTPTYATNSDGTVITWRTSTPSTCSLSTSSQPTRVTFVGTGTCSLSVTVAATADYTSATGTATTQASSAVANKPLKYPLTLTVVGTGAVRSSAGSMNLRHAGSVARTFNAKALVSFTAKPLPGFVQRWSGACSGTALTCRVTMTNAKHVRVAFRAAVTMPVFYFATNMSNITMPAAQVAKFRADLVTLVKLHVKTLTIRAYADYRNGAAYNLALSQRRANSVTAFVENLLVQSGLPRMPIRNLGMGILRASANLQLDRKAIIQYI